MDGDYCMGQDVATHLRNQFRGVLLQLFPPCSLADKPASSTPSPAFTPGQAKGKEEETTGVPSFEPINGNMQVENASDAAELGALTLASELGIGGRLFNACVEAFVARPAQSHSSLRLLLQEALFDTLTDYHCGAAHFTHDTSVGASKPFSHESGCSQTQVLRAAVAVVGRSETWCVAPSEAEERLVGGSMVSAETDPTKMGDNPECLVAARGVCAFVASMAQRVSAVQGDMRPPPQTTLHKRQRSEQACATEEWFAVKGEGSALQLERAQDIMESLRVKCGNMEKVSQRDREILSEVGGVLAALSAACEARTFLGSSACQYGRNRITLASMTAIMQQEVPQEGSHAQSGEQTGDATDPPVVSSSISHGDQNFSQGDCAVGEDIAQHLLGYFVHETGTLYTTDGSRFLMETG